MKEHDGHAHNHLPETCPEVENHIAQTDLEIRNLATKEATIVGRISLLQEDLSEVRAQIRASRYGVDVAKDVIKAYRLHLESLEEKADEGKAPKNGKHSSKKEELAATPVQS